MIRNSVVAKLWLTIVFMFVLVLALLSVLLEQFFNSYVVQQQTNQLTQLARNVQHIMVSDKSSKNETAVVKQVLSQVQQARLTYANPIASKQALSKAYQDFTPREKQDFASNLPVVIHSTGNGINEVTVYLILKTGANQTGMVAVSQDMSVLSAPTNRMRNLILFDTILGIVFATGLAFVVSKNLSRPLLEMNRAAEEMARGHFKQRVNVITTDEVGRLGHTFNELASQLAKTIEQLSLERDQLSSILSSLQDGVIATDSKGLITLANPPALRQIRALSVAEQGVVELEKIPERLMALFAQVFQFQEPMVKEEVWEGRQMVVTMLPLYEVDGAQLRGTLAVLRDITEERRLDRLRKDFIANVSHELRTPLSMMQGYAEALLDDISDDPMHRTELTEIIYDESLRMKRLVNDLLNLAQLESGQFQMQMERIDFTTLMRKVGRKFQALAQDSGVTFAFQTPTDPVHIEADSDRMEQVFTNLLDNAFRHTPDGQITFTADLQANHFLYVRVADTGAGIPEEDVPFIFERFYKADKARTRSSSGTGLGLSIAKHIVLEHGGDILVESQSGKGTTFTVVLPVQ